MGAKFDVKIKLNQIMMDKIEEKNNYKKIKNKTNNNKKTKLDIKNKWDNTFILWQEEEREKKDEKKINPSEPNHYTSTHMCYTTRKRTLTWL